MFHAMLRACFKPKRGRFTPYDVAVVDVLAFCHVQGIELKRFKHLEATYDRCERLALQHVGPHEGQTVATDTAPSETSRIVILPAPHAKSKASAAHGYVCVHAKLLSLFFFL